MKNTCWRICVVVVVAACSGERGKVGPAGGTGNTGAQGPKGDPGPIISSRARLGLDVAPVELSLDGLSSEEIERVGQGSYLVNAAADCVGCHMGPAPTFAHLAGGMAFPANLPPTQFVYAANLTPDGQSGLHRSEDEFIELMRTGKDFINSGDSLRHHPWSTLRWMSTADLKAIYAYLQVIPPVSNQFSRNKSGFSNYTPKAPVPFPEVYNEGSEERALPAETSADRENILRGLAIQPQPIADGDFETLSPEEQRLYGRGSYLVNATALCADCHNNGASGARGAFNDWFDTNRDNDLQIHLDGYLAGGRVFFGLVPGIARGITSNLVGPSNGLFSDPSYTFTDFMMAMDTGAHENPDGSRTPLAPPMSWNILRNLDVDDLLALYVYLVNVPRAAEDPITQRLALACDGNEDCPVGTCDLTHGECTGMSCVEDVDCPACQSCGDGDPVTDGLCGIDPAFYDACTVMGQ